MKQELKKLRRKFNSQELLDELEKILKQAALKNPALPGHCLRVAFILEEIGASKETILAGTFYHFENQPQLESLKEKSREEVSLIVKKVNQLKELCNALKNFKVRPIKEWQKALLNKQAENIRKVCFALVKDLRPILVILADKLDEMRHMMENQPESVQKKQAIMALEILSPLAYGLGMEEIKGQFEDLVFPILYSKEYQWLLQNLQNRYNQTKAYTERIRPQIIKILENKKIPVLEVKSRTKHYFSLYQKLLRHNMDIDKIYDLVATRIIVPDVEACYQAMGVLHNVFKPLPNRIKDYISRPKTNGYRALHTTVIGPENKTIEIQIKTPEMHKEAEFGVAAHLSYKGKFPAKTYKHQFYWLEQLRQWQRDWQELEKISEHLQSDLFKNRVFVFTPKNDAIDLPKGATPVDFAYAIHSDVGDHTEGAKVNGKMVHLNYQLKNSDEVEIIVNKNKSPSEKWLRFVKTEKAKHKIKAFLEKTTGTLPTESVAKAAISSLAQKVSLIKKILPAKLSRKPQILIAGEKGIAAKLAQCCNPKNSDRIVAFITQGEGASVHKESCFNLLELKEKWPQRIVQANWSNTP